MVAGFGVQTALLLDAASFYLVACILLTAPALPHAVPDPGRLRERVRAGLAYIGQRPILRRLLVAQAAAFVFFAAVIPIEVIYAKETLDAGDSGYGLLLASWGGGMIVGSFVFAALRRASLPLLLVTSTAIVGIAYLGLASAPTLTVACTASVLGGIGNGVQWVSTVSAVQELTVAAMQARVMSVLESIGAAMPGLGFLLGGLVTVGHDPRAAFLVAGIGVLAVVVVAAPLLGARWGGDRARSDRRVDEMVLELRPRPVARISEPESG